MADWPDHLVQQERNRQIEAYKALYPKRNKIPTKIMNWKLKLDDSRDKIMALYPEDYSQAEMLWFEKEYLGYYWHSPMTIFDHDADNTIASAIDVGDGYIDVIDDSVDYYKSPRGVKMYKVKVMDSIDSATIVIWDTDYAKHRDFVKPRSGIRVHVTYQQKFKSFNLSRGATVIPLPRLDKTPRPV